MKELKCSFCKENFESYYIESEVSGTIYTHYDLNGELAGHGLNSDMYDQLEKIDKPGKYCSGCNERLEK